MKRCPNCNKIITGRTDKVFCDDKCRNNFYYKFNSEQKTFIRSVNKKLLKNRGIMRAINPSGRTSVPKHYLEEQGFDFNCSGNKYLSDLDPVRCDRNQGNIAGHHENYNVVPRYGFSCGI